jgi:hypothetical protein
MYYEGSTTNKMKIGRDVEWDAISTVNINGTVIHYKLLENLLKIVLLIILEEIILHIQILQASTNGSRTDAQYLSCIFGLDNKYPFANSANGYDGVEFSFGWNKTNPQLCVRRKEIIVWTGLQGFTAGALKGSATISASESLRSSDIRSQRLCFASDGTI